MSRLTNEDQLSSREYIYSCPEQLSDWLDCTNEMFTIAALNYAGNVEFNAQKTACSAYYGKFAYPWTMLSNEVSSTALSVASDSTVRGIYRALKSLDQDGNLSVFDGYAYYNYISQQSGEEIFANEEVLAPQGIDLSATIIDPLPGVHTFANFKKAWHNLFILTRCNYVNSGNCWTIYQPFIDPTLDYLTQLGDAEFATDISGYMRRLSSDTMLEGKGFLGAYGFQAYEQNGMYPLGDVRLYKAAKWYAAFPYEMIKVGNWLYGTRLSAEDYLPAISDDISSLYIMPDILSCTNETNVLSSETSWLAGPGIDEDGRYRYADMLSWHSLDKMNLQRRMVFEHWQTLCDRYGMLLSVDQSGKAIHSRAGYREYDFYAPTKKRKYEDELVYTCEVTNAQLSGLSCGYDYHIFTDIRHDVTSSDNELENEVKITRHQAYLQKDESGTHIQGRCEFRPDIFDIDDTQGIFITPNATPAQRQIGEQLFPETREAERQRDIDDLTQKYQQDKEELENQISSIQHEIDLIYNDEDDVDCELLGRVTELYAQAAQEFGYTITAKNPCSWRYLNGLDSQLHDQIWADPDLHTDDEREEMFARVLDREAELESEDAIIEALWEEMDELYAQIRELQNQLTKLEEEYNRKLDELNHKVYPLDDFYVNVSPFCHLNSVYIPASNNAYIMHSTLAEIEATQDIEKGMPFISSYVDQTEQWPMPQLTLQHGVLDKVTATSYLPTKLSASYYNGFVTSQLSASEWDENLVSALSFNEYGTFDDYRMYKEVDNSINVISSAAKSNAPEYTGDFDAFCGQDPNWNSFMRDYTGHDVIVADTNGFFAHVIPIMSPDNIHYETVKFEGQQRCRCQIRIGSAVMTNDALGPNVHMDFEVNVGECNPGWPTVDRRQLQRWNKNILFDMHTYNKLFRFISTNLDRQTK